MADETTQQQDDSGAANSAADPEDAALWAEFDADETGKAPDEGADGGDANWQPEDADDATSGDHGDVHDGKAAKDEDKGAAPSDVGDQKAKDTADGDAPDTESGKDASKTQADDIWANATPEQRTALEAVQKSEQGLREQLDRRMREISRLKSRQTADTPAPKEAGDDEKTAAYLETDDWKAFTEEYPEVAGPLGSVIGNLQSVIDKQGKELSAIGNDRRQEALDEQANLLTQKHADWEQVVTEDPNAFAGWLDSQPRHVREAFARNQEQIVDAEEAADVVGRFKAFRQAHGQQQNGNGDGQGSATERSDGSDAGQGNGNDQATPPLSDKRKRQLDSAATTRTNGPSGAGGIPESGDEKVLWDQFEKAGL